MQIDIRDATPGDAGLLAQWSAAMALETESRVLTPATILAGVKAGIADAARARYFIASGSAGLGGGETVRVDVGTLMLTREWSDWRNGDWWWIQSVYVDPGYRRRGVLSALYRHVEVLARQTDGVIGLRLYVERDNAVAQRTYSALGMADAGYRIYEAGFSD
ncbi:GNAT family N-acetyltransferase [Lysobacter sp. A03]|uniref:GNAT family N-acetyltransferase n=1 Tax=Lysobacter sp. A03 TaxID=1199154 RepID=UPI0005B69E2A|nr:GNAT family N-acetyltransferase [Lysobacter sp. A03]KIQ98012.1 Protein export cytoplasm protein SecA ATPase RNA helicase [Lysobacter sp. A03]